MMANHKTQKLKNMNYFSISLCNTDTLSYFNKNIKILKFLNSVTLFDGGTRFNFLDRRKHFFNFKMKPSSRVSFTKQRIIHREFK